MKTRVFVNWQTSDKMQYKVFFMTPNTMVMQACKIQYFIKLIAWDSKTALHG